MCKCNVCGKKFKYGDENSPMLNENTWRNVLKFYKLEESEREKEDAFIKVYDLQYETRSKRLKDLIMEVSCHDALHTYICYDCMEKALGRKITKEDLIEENVPFNEAFEKKYFTD